MYPCRREDQRQHSTLSCFGEPRGHLKAQSTQDSLAVGRGRHEVVLVLHAHRACAVSTRAVCHVVVPDVLAVVVIARVLGVAAVVVDVVSRVLSRVSLSLSVIGERTVEPVAIELTIAGRRRGRIFRCAIARIGRCEWSTRPRAGRVLVPTNLLRPVSCLLLGLLRALHARKALILGNLLLVPQGVGLVARTSKVGVDGGHKGCEPLAAGEGLGHLLAAHPLAPVVQPGVVVLASLQVDVEVPTDAHEPLCLQLVQLSDRNTRNFGPGSVLECVVVEKLASEEQGDGQHPPDLSLDRVEGTDSLQAIDPLGEVVHAKEDSGPGQTSGRKDLRDELSERRRDWRLREDQLDGHLGNIFSHHVDLVVEDSTDTSARHVDGLRMRVLYG